MGTEGFPRVGYLIISGSSPKGLITLCMHTDKIADNNRPNIHSDPLITLRNLFNNCVEMLKKFNTILSCCYSN